MLTRPTRSIKTTRRLRLRAHLWRYATTAIASSVAISMGANIAVADDGLQLLAPANQITKSAPADQGWTGRNGAKPEAKSELGKPSQSEKSDSSPAVALKSNTDEAAKPPVQMKPVQSKTVQQLKTVQQPSKVNAQPVSSPLDALRSHAKLPSLTKPSSETKAEPEAAKEIQTPGARALQKARQSTSVGNWRGRGATVGDVPVDPPSEVPAVAPQDTKSEYVPALITESNWVARDAINRVAPLRDPAPKARSSAAAPKASQPAVSPQQAQSQPVRSQPKRVEDVPATAPKQSAQSPAVEPKLTLETADRSSASTMPALEDLPSHADLPPTEIEADDFAPRNSSRPDPVQPAPMEAEPEGSSAEDELSLEQPQAALQPLSDPEPSVEAVLPKSEPEMRLAPQRRSMSLNEAAAKRDSIAEKKEAMAEKLLDSIEPEARISAKPSQAESESAKVARRERRDTLQELPGDAADLKPLPKGNLNDMEPLGGATAKVGDLPVEDEVVQEVSPKAVADEETQLDYSGRPATEITPNRTVASMRAPMERVLRYFYQRPEVANGRSNWGMMHQLMVFGTDTQIRNGNRQYSAIAWIAGNNVCRGQRLLTSDAEGLKAKSGVGLQGHESQFLAVLGMCNVPVEYPLYAGQMKYSVDALIQSEQRGCKEDNELTFTLIGFSHYLDTDATWVGADGSQWDFERLIAEELEEPIVGSACGGTHRLMGYAHALRKRRAEGKPIDGHWKRAEIYTNDFIDYAFSLQNRDGSMSTSWFEGRADNGDVDRKIQTTGHIVEWLLTVTPDDQLQDRRLVAAVSYLLRAMAKDLDHDWSIGPKGHALRSLAMYHQRVFRAGTPWVPQQTASTQSSRNHR